MVRPDVAKYALNQWENLIAYCDHGQLHISNVLVENAIRPFVIGRKGWLFADTPSGAKASALYYTIIETAKANGLDPFKYILHLCRHMPVWKRWMMSKRSCRGMSKIS